MQFSIVTPCYRGAATLPRTFESLLRQNREGIEFEWILVDDYSNDDGRTIAMIEELRKKAPFPTQSVLLEQNYYGARSAHTGAKMAKGDYVIILDQDDMLSDEGLQIFRRLIEKYSPSDKFAGVCGRCNDLNGRLIGTPFKWKEKLSNELEIRHIEKIRGEMFQCTKRELVEKFFSDFEPGYTNGYAWTRIAREYRYAYTHEVVRVYDTGNPFSVSHAKKLKYLKQSLFQYGHYLNTNIDYLRNDPVFLSRWLLQYIRLAIHLGFKKSEVWRSLPREMAPFVHFIYPVSVVKAALDKSRGRV